MYIIDKIQGREIDRFVLGGYALESTQGIHPMTHSKYALALMERNKIGVINNAINSYLLINN